MHFIRFTHLPLPKQVCNFAPKNQQNLYKPKERSELTQDIKGVSLDSHITTFLPTPQPRLTLYYPQDSFLFA